jgi:DNA mismatch endonuclease (patch repair protein)
MSKQDTTSPPVTPQRSALMARVKTANTAPEIAVRRWLHKAGYRFRLHRRDLPGRPDIVLPRHRLVIFVHGCFWHRHPHCRHASLPRTRTDFWEEKFARNVARDLAVQEELRHLGWRVLIVWECETRKHETLEPILRTALPKRPSRRDDAEDRELSKSAFSSLEDI